MAIVGTTKRIVHPLESDVWVEIRRLSWRQKEQASEIASDEALSKINKLGNNLVSAMKGMADQQVQSSAARYDKGTVLKFGLVRWSYNAPVTPENIDLLDEETADWIFQEILDAGKPLGETQRLNV